MSIKHSYPAKLCLAVLLVGGATGLGAILLHELLDQIQHLAYHHVDGEFLILSSHVSPLLRFVAVLVGGILVAGSWYLLQKKRKLLSIKAQIEQVGKGENPHFLKQFFHALTQILAVGTGMPVGKEVAPRELGTLFAGRISRRLSEDDQRLLMASAAAAGLAAVYQVPLASFVFLFESLKIARTWKNALVGGAVIGLATLMAQLAIIPHATYQTEAVELTWQNLALAVLLGLIFPILALQFKAHVKQADSKRVKDQAILWRLPLTALLVGLVAFYFPEVLGNGRDLAQTAFSGESPIWYLLALFLLKWGLTLLALKSGAYGGTLTPSFALGASLSALLTASLAGFFPSIQPAQVSVLGAASFLGIAMSMPVTAIFLTLGFTGQPLQAIIPIALAVAVSECIKKQIENKEK